MSLRTTVGIPPFGPTGTPRVLLFLGSFCKLSQSAPLSDFRFSYQNFIRIVIWLFFLVVYSQAGTIIFPDTSRSSNVVRTVREPLDRLDPLRSHLDVWEITLYVMALAFTLEGASIDVLEHDYLQVMKK
jgi:hypothetical protein